MINKKFVIYILIGSMFIAPSVSLASDVRCSPNGYTISTINGIFTSEQGAQDNMIALQKAFGFDWRDENVDYQYFFNPSHLAGAADVLKSVQQKLFDSWAVGGYDFVEMLKDASDKVKTQKLLIVGYSQGNFYANSLYDTLADNVGGVPAESIAVYGVATPAGRVAGGGKYITSDTDKVIAGWVNSLTLGNIMKPNTNIEFQEQANGHSFSNIYLKYRGEQIVSDIQSSLDKLSINNIQDADKPCIDAPELNLAHKAQGAALAILDPVAGGILTARNAAYDTATSAARGIADGLWSLVQIAAHNINNIFSLRDGSNPPVHLSGQISNAIPVAQPVPQPAPQPQPTREIPVARSIAPPTISPQALIPRTPPATQLQQPSQLEPTITLNQNVQVTPSSRSGHRSGNSSSAPEPSPVSPLSPTPPPAPIPPPELPLYSQSSYLVYSESSYYSESAYYSESSYYSESAYSPPPLPAQPEVANFSVDYDSAKLELEFSWTPFTTDPPSVVTHKILDANGESIFETTSGSSYRLRIYEVGRDYSFSIKAFDANGIELASTSITEPLSVPSFTRDTRFYSSDYRYFGADTTGPLVEFSYDSYPFAPRDLVYAPNGVPSTGPNFKAAVFYLNREAPQHEYLFNNNPLEEDLGSVLRIKYKVCAGGSPYFNASLILPDGASQCGATGGVQNSAIDWPSYLAEGDKHLLLPAQKPDGATNFSEDDYFTGAYYGFFRSYPQGTSVENGGSQTFKLLAVDNTRHSFNDLAVVTHQKPDTPTNLQFSLNSEKAILTTSWDAAKDTDSLDAYLRYEISYDDGATWTQSAGLSHNSIVSPGVAYSIKVRAIDDFGEKSGALSGSFDVPEIPSPFGLSNFRWGSETGSASLSFDYPSYPFITGNGNPYDAMVFYFNRLPPLSYDFNATENSSYSQVKVTYTSCDSILTDFQKLILTRNPLPACDASGNNIRRYALYPFPNSAGGSINLPIRALSNANKSIAQLSEEDYFTVGFYRIDGIGVFNPGNVTLVANDTHRYQFIEPAP